MGFFDDVFAFERFHAGDLWDRLKKDPKRLVLGVDPASTAVWNKVLGRDDEPLVDQMGGPYDGHFISLGQPDENGQLGGVYGRAAQAGVPTDAGLGMHQGAHAIAAMFATQGLAGIGGGGEAAAGKSPFGFGPEMFQGGGGMGNMGAMNFNPFGGGTDPNASIPGATPGINPMAQPPTGILGSMGGGGLLNGGGLTPQQSEALMAAAAHLLQSGGYSTMPTTFGQAFGGAMQAGRGAYNENVDAQYRRALIESQIAENMRGRQYQTKYENLLNRTTNEVRRVEVGTKPYVEMINSGEWVGTGDVKLPGEDESKRAKQIADLKRLYPSMSEEHIVGLVDGYYDVTSQPNEAGLMTITDKVSGRAFQVPATLGRDGYGGGGAGVAPAPTGAAPTANVPSGAGNPMAPNQPLPYTSPEAQKEAQMRLINYGRVMSQFDDALAAVQAGGIGPLSNVQRAVTAGASLIGSEGFADNFQNREKLRQFNGAVAAALANNPRVPVWEQEQIQRTLPSPDDWFVNPKNAARRLGEIKRRIDNLEAIDRALLKNDPLPVDSMGQGSPEQPFVFMDVKDLQAKWSKVPPGAYWIDPENGVLRRKKPKE